MHCLNVDFGREQSPFPLSYAKVVTNASCVDLANGQGTGAESARNNQYRGASPLMEEHKRGEAFGEQPQAEN